MIFDIFWFLSYNVPNLEMSADNFNLSEREMGDADHSNLPNLEVGGADKQIPTVDGADDVA